VGDGSHKDTAAIQKTVDSANAAGGGTVYFPPGKYLSGTILLKNSVTLHIDRGAVLLGSTDGADFPPLECSFRSYTDRYVHQALIYGEGLHDVGIEGRGTIDGQGEAFEGLPYRERPYVIRLVSCRNVSVETITLRNSPMWMQHYLDCDNVSARGIQVYNHCNANNDMIDIDCCRDVRISDCVSDTDDDGLTLKSTADRPCENVVVTNCILASHCNAVKMGTESNGGFKNIAIANCAIRQSVDDTPKAGRREGIAAIALEIVDGGTLDQVTISNIAITGVSVPLFVRLGNRARPFKEDMPKPGVGALRNVILSNIVATGAGPTGCSISGLPGHPVDNITLSDISISFSGGGTQEDAKRVAPELPEKYPEGTMFGTLPSYGLFCRHVKGLTLRNVQFRKESDDLRPALMCDDVTGLDIDGFDAWASPSAISFSADIRLREVQQAMVRGCIARCSNEPFLCVDDGCKNISAIGNDFSQTLIPFIFTRRELRSELFADANRPPKNR
jgi:hypothetical protein